MRNEKLGLAVLFLISLFISICLFFRTYVISLDGAFQYIPIAKDFASGLFEKGLSHDQQPLYSVFVAFLSQGVPDFELAGKLVSTFFGILMIFPVYFLGKQIFDSKVAFFSSLFLVVHPYIRRYSADVLKESTYLFFLATALCLAWKAIQEEKKYGFLLIPLFSALAYLVRPDGFEVLLVVFFYVIFVKKFSIPGKRRTVVLVLFLSSCILFLPYFVHLREVKGLWTLSKAKSIGGMLGLEVMKDGVPFVQKILYSLKRLNLEILGMFHPVYILLLMVGLTKKIFFPRKNGEGFLLGFGVLHYSVLFLMVLNTTVWGADKAVQADHLSGRHGLPLLFISIFWAGEGFLTIHQWISKKTESQSLMLRTDAKRKHSIILAVLLVVLLAMVLPKTLKPQRYERLPEKWAGTWIKNQYGKGMNIFTTLPRVVYYADGEGEYIDIRKNTLENVEPSMVKKKALFLVIREDEIVDFFGNAEAFKKDFIELIRFEGEGMEKIVIYKAVQ